MAFTADELMQARDRVIDPFTTDRTPKVSVEINGVEIDRLNRYCYDSDLLQLGDPFSVVLPDPHQSYKINEGDSIKLYMADPDVAGGKKVAKVKGIVTTLDQSCDPDRGTVYNVGGADLGWHLVNNDAPIWRRLAGKTFLQLCKLLVDTTWGFAGFRLGNDSNVRLKLGGNYARSTAQLGDKDKPPIVQIEPGDKPADIIIQYAKLANKLVNVSADGYLQLFAPRYDTPVAYKFFHYVDKDRAPKNNVQRARLSRSLNGRYTKAVCVGTRLIPLTEGVDPNDPNAQNFRGTYTRPRGVLTPNAPPPLPFDRLVAFCDPDRLSRTQAAARAKWMLQRGEFDAWMYELTVGGHSQGGLFYEPDTMCEVHDYVFGIEGNYYITAVRYTRDAEGGTSTTLTIRRPNLLAA